MCGHMSYFKESDGRTVTALDYCEISLERYPYPSRRRIQCDLDQLVGGRSLPFFQDEQFDAISICFGYKYLKDIDTVVREFRRILKVGGVLSLVEGSRHGYEHLFVRQFNTRMIRDGLISNGYGRVDIKKIHVPGWDEDVSGAFYHIEAEKI